MAVRPGAPERVRRGLRPCAPGTALITDRWQRTAHDGLRGAAGPIWRESLTLDLGNLRAALDWFIASGDADGALSLASGMAWLWFINTDCLEGARWLADALAATGSRRPELAATAQVWHGYCVCMSSRPSGGYCSNARPPSRRCGPATTGPVERRRWC